MRQERKGKEMAEKPVKTKKKACWPARFLAAGCVFCLGMAAYLGYAMQEQRDVYTQEKNSLLAEISDLNRRISDEEGYVPDSEVLADAMTEAAVKGSEVAELQTNYNNIQNISSGEGGSYEEIHAISEELLPYFQDGQYASQWFFSAEAVRGDVAWEFVPVYEVSSESVPCIWLCRLKGDPYVLAYASGSYSVAEQIFTDMSAEMTTYGYNYSSNATSLEEPDTESTQDSGDELWENGISPFDIVNSDGPVSGNDAGGDESE